MQPKYSVVIPLKNEEDNIIDLIAELEPAMEQLKAPWELICIDDGSTDRTQAILKKIASEKPFLRTIFFDRNYGQSSAFDAGFKKATGKWVITLDGDRQNDPADIPKMVSLAKNYDLVCGCRTDRRDPFLKRLISLCANFIRSRFCNDQMKDTGCSLKIYRKECLERIKMYKGMHRFLPALFKIEGFKVIETPVNHRERIKGKTKYHFFNRSFNTIADMFVVRWMWKRRIDYQINKDAS